MIELNKSAAQAMEELGVKSATDITGFGLAGHAWEMANGSGVTIEISLPALPILSGAEELAQRGFLTRASKTNAEYVAKGIRFEGMIDPIRLKVFYDAQTSGGLLMAVPSAKADQAEEVLRRHKTLATACVGWVRERQADVDLIVTG
jgi:selenide,water dikinase